MAKSTDKLWDDTNILLTLPMYMVEEAKRFIEPDIDDPPEANTGEEENECKRRLFLGSHPIKLVAFLRIFLQLL